MKEIHKKNIISIAAIAFTIAVFLFFFRNLQIGVMWSFSDLLPFDNEKRADLFFGTWDSNMLGYPFISSSTPLILLCLGTLIKNDIIVQNLYYLSFIPLSFVTMYILSQKLISGAYGRYFASFLYALNPITIGEFYNGSVWMNIYIIAPLIIFLTIEFLERKNLNVFYGLMISILLGLTYSTVWILVWTILFPIFIVTLIKSIKEIKNGNHDIFRRIGYLLIFFMLGVILLLPSIDYIIFTKEKAFRQDSIQSLFGDVKNNYKDAIPEYIIRMAGNSGSPMDLLGYNEYSWWTFFGYIVTIFVLFQILDRKSMKNTYYVSFFIIISITIIFMSMTHFQLTYRIYENVPFLFSLRNPKYIMYSFSLAISILFGLGIHKFLNPLDARRIYAVSFIVLMSLIIYLYPIWNGDMGLNNKATYTVPKYYSDTFAYLKNDDSYFRVLWLPYTYSMQTRLANSINHAGVKLGQDLFSSPSYEKIENLFRSIENNRTENFSQKIGSYNVKYVIIDKNFDVEQQREFSRNFSEDIGMHYAYKTPFIHGSPEKFIEFVDLIDGLEKKYEDGNVVIYENNYFIPYIFILNVSTEQKSDIMEKNIIENPDFLNSTDHWKIWNVNDGRMNISNKSMNITNPDNKNSILITQGFNATRVNKYRLSIDLKTTSNFTHVKIAWYDQDKDLSEKNAIGHSIAKKYLYKDGSNKYEETFMPPEDTVYGVLFLAGGKTTTILPAYSYFTNISIREIDQDASIIILNMSDAIPLENYEKTNGKLTFNIKANKNSTIVLSESFNENWNAYAGDEKLTHVEILDWANGFKIPEDQDGIVTIEYAPQKNRNTVIFIWIAAWIFVIAWMILLIYDRSKRS